jgi:prepilin-type N-terminal cleavage/methylation domain-containing protein
MQLFDIVRIRQENGSQSGFTLIEILIGIVIIGILGGLATVAMMGMSAKGGAQRAADEMYGVIMEAKMRAVRNNINVNINFDIANNRYTCDATGETVALNKYRGNVVFTNAPDGLAPVAQLVFSPQGFATTPGDVYLVERNHNTFYRLQTSYAGVTTVKRWSEGAATWH